MNFLEFKDVSKEYRSGDTVIKALNKVNFKVAECEFVVILGPSGSGKSTLLNLLGGMDRLTSGQIILNGQKVNELNEKALTNYRKDDIGFVFQFYNIISSLSAFENVDMAYRLTTSKISPDEAIKAVGLDHRSNYFPSQLSGGELQRVSIARALCKEPTLMLCDEPTGALDSETGKMIFKLLKLMVKKYHTTVIVVTHNESIASISDKVIRLKDGEIKNIETNEKPLDVEEVIW